MKKSTISLLILLPLILSACNGTAASVENTPTTDAMSSATETSTTIPTGTATPVVTLVTDYENAIAVADQLLYGTLALENTDNAVSKEQAGYLLPLWINYQSLSQFPGPGQQGQGAPAGGTPSQMQGQESLTIDAETQAQLDEVIREIMAAMTPAQIQAIADMQITQESAQTILAGIQTTLEPPQQGQGTAPGGENGVQQPPQGSTDPGAAGGGAQPPAGNGQQMSTPPADMNGQAPAGQALGTQPSGMNEQGQEFFSPAIINALLQLLQNKISATGSLDGSSNIYVQSGGAASQQNQFYSTSKTDESAVHVLDGGSFTLISSIIDTSGETSSTDDSRQKGQNAAILAESGSTITVTTSTVTTCGAGANGVFSVEDGSLVDLTNVSIETTGDSGSGIRVVRNGSVKMTSVNVATTGDNASALAIERGGGSITASGGTITTSGTDSPGIFSTGSVTLADASVTASISPVAAIDGANSINLTNTSLISNADALWGVLFYDSESETAREDTAAFTMNGGSLAYNGTTGPLFYVTNGSATITLNGTTVSVDSGLLLKAADSDTWGTDGANGGDASLTVSSTSLTGYLEADAISSISATFNSSTLTGAINTARTAKAASLTLDAASVWTVTADSHLTCLNDPDGIAGGQINNITGNGYTVTYNANACPALGGGTYQLAGSGLLVPSY